MFSNDVLGLLTTIRCSNGSNVSQKIMNLVRISCVLIAVFLYATVKVTVVFNVHWM